MRIFECEEGYGSFLLGKNVTVGDFPERDLMDSDDEGAEKVKDAIEDEDEDEIWRIKYEIWSVVYDVSTVVGMVISLVRYIAFSFPQNL